MVKEVNMMKVKKLIWSDLSLREIEKLTGIGHETTRRLREGIRSTDSLKVGMAHKYEQAFDKLAEEGKLRG